MQREWTVSLLATMAAIPGATVATTTALGASASVPVAATRPEPELEPLAVTFAFAMARVITELPVAQWPWSQQPVRSEHTCRGHVDCAWRRLSCVTAQLAWEEVAGTCARRSQGREACHTSGVVVV